MTCSCPFLFLSFRCRAASKTSVRIPGKWLFQNRHHKSVSPPTSNSIRAQQDILVPYCVLSRWVAGVWLPPSLCARLQARMLSRTNN